MSLEYKLLRWIILSPLITFFINFLFKRYISKLASGIIASIGVFLSFIISFVSFNKIRTLPSEISLYDTLFKWIGFNDINVYVSFNFDHLSSIMALVVSGVSFLIHVYSMEYMKDDKDYIRFFSYLNLFVFFMLLLVLADNILLMFVGWEGVGLCSYLLIGFWYENINNSIAGKKAFITNRIGDAFFIAGIIITHFVLFKNSIYDLSFSTINSSLEIFYNTKIFGYSSLTIITFLFFMGATGKSAQFPLYVWLPDAMAGPTPVSALIHAATMVTAGVYLIAKLNPLYENAHLIKDIILYIASFTAILSAIIAITQRDIKKILAYSTISQLGYMFMGVVTINWAGGVFHLVTHAFFKALLFLTAGAVIHSLSGEQDIFNMGNLKNKLKSVFVVMVVGWLAITGFPFLSGYFSKDFIIENLYLSGHKNIWFISIITAFITGFYMTRLFNIAFIQNHEKNYHIHSPGYLMTIPLYILAFLSISAGYFLKPFLSFMNIQIDTLHIPTTIKNIPLFVSIAGIIAGFYFTRKDISDKLETKFKYIYSLITNKFYVDEIYDFIIIKPLKLFAETTFRLIDRKLIDTTIVEGVAKTMYFTGSIFSKLENSKIRFYTLYILLGITLVIIVILRSF